MCLLSLTKPSNKSSNGSKSKNPKPTRIPISSLEASPTRYLPALNMPKPGQFSYAGHDFEHPTAPLPPMLQTRSSRKFYPQISKQTYSIQEDYMVHTSALHNSPAPNPSHRERKLARRSSLLDDIDFFHTLQRKLSPPKAEDQKHEEQKEDKEIEDMRAELANFRKAKEKGEWKGEIASLRRDLEEKERERALSTAVATAREEGAAMAREKEAEKQREAERERNRMLPFGSTYGAAAGLDNMNPSLGLQSLGFMSSGGIPRIIHDPNINWQFSASSNTNMPQSSNGFRHSSQGNPGMYGRDYHGNDRRYREDEDSNVATFAGMGGLRIIDQRLSRMEDNQAANQAILDAMERDRRFERATRRNRYFD